MLLPFKERLGLSLAPTVAVSEGRGGIEGVVVITEGRFTLCGITDSSVPHVDGVCYVRLVVLWVRAQGDVGIW